MTTLLTVVPIVVRRIRANARLLLAVLIGAVLASALLSTTSIYTDAIRSLGLAFAIREKGVDKTNIMISSRTQPSRLEVYQKNKDFIDGAEKQALGPVLAGQNWAGRSATFFPTPPGERVSEADDRPRSNLQFVTNLESHVRIVDGRFPAAARSNGSTAPTIEVALGAPIAQRLGIKAGDRFDLHPFWQADTEPVHATVVGLVAPLNQAEPYWLGMTDFFDPQTPGWPTLEFFVAEGTFFDSVTSYLPTMSSDFLSMVYLDTKRINPRNADAVRSNLESLDRQIASNIERTSTATELPSVLRDFAQKLFFSRIPLLVLVLQIAGIVLYYLFMVSTMLVERQAAEIALLKSRGATTTQVMQIYVLEGFAILVVALVAGPPLAAGLIAVLGRTPAFHDLSGGAYLSVRITGSAYLWALAGALLAYLTLLLPAYQATHQTMVQQRTQSARPPKEVAFTRYYLDLGLVGLGAILFYQLNRRGSLITEKLFGHQSADPVSLLTPAFFILAVGVVFLRLFPLVLRGATWALSKAQGTAILLGMWQLVRNPVHYSRLILLLMLATAVGMFAASYGATLNKSYADRAGYQAGAGIRVEDIRRTDATRPNGLADTVKQQFAASAASAAFRSEASYGPTFGRTDFHLLGIDPSSFGDVAFYRSDFASRSLGSILAVLSKDSGPAPGIELPADVRWAGIWVRPVDLNGRVGVNLTLRDAAGRYFTAGLGPTGGAELPQGWSFLAGDLTRLQSGFGDIYAAAPPQPPLSLQSISIAFFSRVSANNGTVDFDRLQTSSDAALPPPLAQSTVIPDPDRTFVGLPSAHAVGDFATIGGWEVLDGLVAQPLNDGLRSVSSQSGTEAIELSWRPVAGQPQTHGLRVRGDGRPVSVFASDAFVKRTGLGAGRQAMVYVGGAYIDVVIAGTFHLFPTLGDSRNDPALIANLDGLLAALNRNPRSNSAYPNEAWIKPGPETTAKVNAAISSGSLNATLYNFDALRSGQRQDPLVAAGWEGMLFLSFGAVLVLSAVGFLIYSYLTAQKRSLEFAVLRTMGFSRRQIATLVGFEQLFVIGLGMAAGTLMGIRLGSLMIRYTGVSETGASIVPPMVLHVSWLTAGTALLVLGSVFVVTIGIVVLLYSRLALHRVLRIGET